MKTWTRDEDKACLPDEPWQGEPDKACLPDGPWQGEPDKAVWVDETTGLDCMIHRNPVGALCGYVAVPVDHPWHGQHYDAVEVDVHGGLTYSAGCEDTGDEANGICHVPEPGRPHDVWWLGFDCAHAGDLLPACPLFGDMAGDRETYRSFDYVRQEIERLAKQAHSEAGGDR